MAPSAACTRATSAGSTNRNSAAGSTKRRISHAVAARLTRMARRVTHFTARPSLLRRVGVPDLDRVAGEQVEVDLDAAPVLRCQHDELRAVAAHHRRDRVDGPGAALLGL